MVTVTFTPTLAETATGELVITSDDADNPEVIVACQVVVLRRMGSRFSLMRTECRSSVTLMETAPSTLTTFSSSPTTLA